MILSCNAIGAFDALADITQAVLQALMRTFILVIEK